MLSHSHQTTQAEKMLRRGLMQAGRDGGSSPSAATAQGQTDTMLQQHILVLWE